MKDSTLGYIGLIITIVMACILFLGGCVSPSRYDIELANKQNENTLMLMTAMEEKDKVFATFLVSLEKRITILEYGRMYQLAPTLDPLDVVFPQQVRLVK